jgi:outer membrane protein assembly factor BamE
MTGTHPLPTPRSRRLQPRRLAVAAALAGAVATLAGCQSTERSSGLFEPYRVAVPQGNYLDRSMLEQVRPGMTPEQVRFALGSPLLVSAFHPDRWDYVFRYQFPDGSAITRRASVLFRDGRVDRIEAEALPAREDPTDPALPGYRRAPRAPRAT